MRLSPTILATVTDTSDLDEPLVVSVSRRIDAPAQSIFDLLCDPRRHREIDGSTMVRDSDDLPVQRVGDSFVMRMYNEDFGEYEMRSEVIEYVRDREIAWAPNRHDIEEESWDHRWGWRLAPDGEATSVTAYFDCRRVPPDALRILRNGEWGRPILTLSLERLALIFEG
jgi:uncharacterized protein YndB with AHSA1/START domain